MFHNKFGILSARCLFRGITVNMDIKGVELSGSRLQGCTDQIIRDIGKCQVLKLHDIRTGRTCPPREVPSRIKSSFKCPS